MSVENIHCRLEIAASRARVWTALTEAGLVEQWLGCLGFRPAIGTVFYMQPDTGKRAAGDVTGATHCELLELEAPERMRFSWFMPGTPKTHVEIRLSEEGDMTWAELVHDGWDQFDPDQIRALRDMLAGGWSSYVLPGLKLVAEAG